MNPLAKVYWIRLALGIVAAAICAGYATATGRIPQTSPEAPFPIDIALFLNSMSLAIIVYLISYYLIKNKFVLKVEKTQKLFTTGIGIYFLSWLVFWVLLYTIIAAA